MKKALLLMFLPILAGSMAFGATACSDPSLYDADVQASGFECSLGSLLFSNFHGVLSSTVILGDSSSWDGHMAILDLRPGLNNRVTHNRDITLLFEVTGGVSEVDATLGGGVPGSGENLRSISETVCDQPFDRNTCPIDHVLGALGVDDSTPYGSVILRSYRGTAYILKDIWVPTGTSLSDFTQSFTVPEPMTLLLIGGGLLGLGLLRRKRA